MSTIKRFLFVILLLSSVSSYALHIKGGWMYYEYVRTETSGHVTYKVVVKLYRDCATPNPGQNDTQIPISIFRTNSNSRVTEFTAPQTRIYRLEKSTFSDCINPKPQVCYVIIEYTGEVTLPPIPGGYIASFQRCCRINGISNVVPPSNSLGNTYMIYLPGTDVIGGAVNSSPKFVEKDTVAVCYKSPIELDYSANDADGDSLVYAFTSALTGGSPDTPSPVISDPPPFRQVPYSSGYSSTNPFGTNVIINPKTGIITGISPAQTGEYVLSVAIKEYRNGSYIAETRKELHVNVAACSFVAAQLPLRITSCDGYTVAFENLSTSASINSYYWDFGVKNSLTDTSTLPKPTYVYPDTGVFVARLIVNRNTSCVDSATSQVSVFPGFFPDFSYNGSCFSNPFQFNDQSSTRYGFINSWRWDFGNTTANNDTSLLKNPQYLYPAAIGEYKVLLQVTSNKGCSDTVSKTIQVIDKPLLELPFKDTLICSIDSLVLRAIGTGNFSWTPTDRMLNSNAANPTVFPFQTTTYTVSLNDRGCLATDTVRVNVLNFVTVNAGNDTTICRTDAIQLRPVSLGLQYVWSPAIGLDDPNIKNPIATPLDALNTYRVTVNLGKCQASDIINIKTVPYPVADAGADTSICFNDTVILRGLGVGSSYQWAPASLVGFPGSLVTPAYPRTPTAFVLSIFQTLGCPKPGMDTVLINVVPPLSVFAGNDTSIVIGQPLQLNASTNGSIYNWVPATGMNNTTILNPLIVLSAGSIPGNSSQLRYVLEVTTPEGCVSSDDILVRLFTTVPSIFVPNAFTPNQDGKNDNIKPILAGMKQLVFFRIYNRYGQIIFETKEQGKGWDGRFKGELQSSNAFVYSCEAEDYTGKLVKREGTFVLVR